MSTISNQSEVLSKTMEWVKQPVNPAKYKFLILRGDNGVGKTFIADHCDYPPWHKAPWVDVVNEWDITGSWPHGLAILDDVRKDTQMGRFQVDPRHIFSAIVEAVENGMDKRLIITTNETEAALARWCGTRAWNRLTGHGYILAVTGESMRGKEGDAGTYDPKSYLRQAAGLFTKGRRYRHGKTPRFNGVFDGISKVFGRPHCSFTDMDAGTHGLWFPMDVRDAVMAHSKGDLVEVNDAAEAFTPVADGGGL